MLACVLACVLRPVCLTCTAAWPSTRPPTPLYSPLSTQAALTAPFIAHSGRRAAQASVPIGEANGPHARVLIPIEVEGHHTFTRDGADIHMSHTMRLAEALLGAQVKVGGMGGRLAVWQGLALRIR